MFAAVPTRDPSIIRLPALDSITPLSITDVLVRIPLVSFAFFFFTRVLWKREFRFCPKNIRDRYASNNQALQKSGIFVEATNEIEGQLSTSEKTERDREPHHGEK